MPSNELGQLLLRVRFLPCRGLEQLQSRLALCVTRRRYFGTGWFSLNVPSGLVLYWLTNNILTTVTSVWLKSTIQPPAAVTSAGTTMGRSTIVNPVIDVEAGPARPSGLPHPSPTPVPHHKGLVPFLLSQWGNESAVQDLALEKLQVLRRSGASCWAMQQVQLAFG